MNLNEVLSPGSVLLDLSLQNKARAISQVAALLGVSARIPAATIETALFAREALGSTGVGGGVGLPHARLHVLRSTHAVFLRLDTPIGFDSIDGKPVDLVCGIVARDEPNAELLTALGAISRVLRDATKTAALRETRDAEEARRILLQTGT